MITCRIYRDGAPEERSSFAPEIVEACRAAGDRRLWLDVVDPSDEELRALQEALGLHELSVEDSRRWGQRSKVEPFPDYVFLVVHGIRLDERRELVDSEIHLFAGQGFYLLTVRREPLFGFPRTAERASADSGLVREGIGYHLYLLLDEIVDGYLDAVDVLEDLADGVEEQVFGEEAAEGLQEQVFRLRRQLVRFRRVAAPLREVVDLVSERTEIATPPLVPYYRDVQDHVIRAIELIDNIRELVTSVLEVRLVQASNRLNVVMKQLSAWAAIILIPTLIAGIYGMNFRHLPELDWGFGYPFALGLMAASAYALYRVFRRRDWL
ncbi:MAG TPA: magnesium/cobalt transporter CorA [Actinomycetota bacterium]